MNLENPVKIIVYSLSIAFVCKMMIVPFIIKLYMNYLERRVNKIKSTIKKDDNWSVIIGEINSIWNKKRSEIVSATRKPFDCIKCMSFWVSITLSVIGGLQGEAALVGIVGLACGMILEGIIMRWL
jgi:hypothetical protein